MSENLTVDKVTELLLKQDGITKVNVEVKLTATVRKQNTGETDEMYQPIRERVISEDEIATLVKDSNWSYSGTVDIVGDFQVRDRLRTQYNVEKQNE